MLRLIKSDAEIKLLRESASLASRAITKVRGSFLSFFLFYICEISGSWGLFKL